MTETDTNPSNVTANDSNIGMAAGEIHNSTVNMFASHHDPPEKKYRDGVRFLREGVPSRARDLIGAAIASDYDGVQVRFHWALAMLSKRAFRDLTSEEHDQLSRLPDLLDSYPAGEWKRALEVICELLDHAQDPEADPGPTLQQLDALQPSQRHQITRHLDLVLTGGVKDARWTEMRSIAQKKQLSGDRIKRVWAYFQRDPIQARARIPAPDGTTIGDWVYAVLTAGVSLVAIGYLGWAVLVHATPGPILAFVLSLVAGFIAARNGLEWKYRRTRLQAKEREYTPRPQVPDAPEGGFTRRVNGSFEYYFNKYPPNGISGTEWSRITEGIRQTLSDEIADVYRESRIPVERVNWLIRFLARDTARRWREGSLRDYRLRYRTEPVTKIRCCLALAAVVLALIVVVNTALAADPLVSTIAGVGALISGRIAVVRWWHIISERRRALDEYEEYKQCLADREKEFERWKALLAATRPSEEEMESWLDCDKTVLVDEALRFYGLAWRDVIAYSFLHTSAKSAKRKRIDSGPWRYSRYDMRLFLITEDGVRELSTELNFENATFSGQDRKNYRFDAVSSVDVTKTKSLKHTLELTLNNGPTRNISVPEPETPGSQADADSTAFARINLDAAGFTPTLHILEGIAAEGKGWIRRTPYSKRPARRATANEEPTTRKNRVAGERNGETGTSQRRGMQKRRRHHAPVRE